MGLRGLAVAVVWWLSAVTSPVQPAALGVRSMRSDVGPQDTGHHRSTGVINYSAPLTAGQIQERGTGKVETSQQLLGCSHPKVPRTTKLHYNLSQVTPKSSRKTLDTVCATDIAGQLGHSTRALVNMRHYQAQLQKPAAKIRSVHL